MRNNTDLFFCHAALIFMVSLFLDSSPLINWFIQRVRRLHTSLKKRWRDEEDWQIKSMPVLPMFYQNATTTMPMPAVANKNSPLRQYSGYHERGTGELFLTPAGKPSICDADRFQSNISSSMRRCLSLSENQPHHLPPINQNPAPFSMDVILEAPLNPPEQQRASPKRASITQSSFAQSNAEPQIFTSQHWHANDLTAESVFSLNAGLAGNLNEEDRISGTESKVMFFSSVHEGSPKHFESLRQELGDLFEPRSEASAAPYIGRSGRDSGFTESGPVIFNPMHSSAYSAVHSRHLSEPLAQDTREMALLGTGCQDVLSSATTSMNTQSSNPDTWWVTGSKTIPSGLKKSSTIYGASGHEKRITPFFKMSSPLQLVQENVSFPEK